MQDWIVIGELNLYMCKYDVSFKLLFLRYTQCICIERILKFIGLLIFFNWLCAEINQKIATLKHNALNYIHFHQRKLASTLI